MIGLAGVAASCIVSTLISATLTTPSIPKVAG
jgi:hypothetical protein